MEVGLEEQLEARTNRLLWIFVPLGTLVMLFTAVMAFLTMRPKEVITAPTGFTAYVASDRSFTCQAPQGWNTTSVSSHAVMGGALFQRGSAKIDITTDLAGSLMGDIAVSADRQAENMEGMLQNMPAIPGMPAMEPSAPRKPPIEKLHEAERKSMEKRYPGYQELAMQTVNAPVGEGRFNEFTVPGSMLSPAQHGFRVTFLPPDRRVTILCLCPEKNWPTLKPAFEKVITSMAAGGG
jgi:hypothetical protein